MRRHFWTTNFGLSQESSISYLVFTQEIFWKKKDLPHLVPIDLKRMFLDRILLCVHAYTIMKFCKIKFNFY